MAEKNRKDNPQEQEQDLSQILQVRPDLRIAPDLSDHVFFADSCKRQRHHGSLPTFQQLKRTRT